MAILTESCKFYSIFVVVVVEQKVLFWLLFSLDFFLSIFLFFFLSFLFFFFFLEQSWKDGLFLS